MRPEHCNGLGIIIYDELYLIKRYKHIHLPNKKLPQLNIYQYIDQQILHYTYTCMLYRLKKIIRLYYIDVFAQCEHNHIYFIF